MKTAIYIFLAFLFMACTNSRSSQNYTPEEVAVKGMEAMFSLNFKEAKLFFAPEQQTKIDSMNTKLKSLPEYKSMVEAMKIIHYEIKAVDCKTTDDDQSAIVTLSMTISSALDDEKTKKKSEMQKVHMEKLDGQWYITDKP